MTKRQSRVTDRISKHENAIDNLINKLPNTIEVYEYLDVDYCDRKQAKVKQENVLKHILAEIQKKYRLDYRHLTKMAKIATDDYYEKFDWTEKLARE